MSSTIDQRLEVIQVLLTQEKEAGPINRLDQLDTSRHKRAHIADQLAQIDAELTIVRQQIKNLPALPPMEPILWAQSVLKMDSALVMEIDTTGIDEDSEIIRVTLGNIGGSLFDDILIKPQGGAIPASATAVNGISSEQVEDAPSLADVWERRIWGGLRGRYVVSFAQNWDRQVLEKSAQRYNLPPVFFIGEDLQRRTTQYYHKEYGLRLADLAERITGQPLPRPATGIERVRAQAAIISGIAGGVYDKRPPKPATSQSDSVQDDTELNLDDHPF